MSKQAWKNIETAPTDGTAVLVCSGNLNYYYPESAFFGTYHTNAKGKPCWRSCTNSTKINPLYWQGLPPKPTQQEVDSG